MNRGDLLTDEIVESRNRLQARISELLSEFTQETGATVSMASVTPVHVAHKLPAATYDVRVEVAVGEIEYRNGVAYGPRHELTVRDELVVSKSVT